MSKPILCLDLDGVIHAYSKGWQDGSIYDGVTPGFFDWLHTAVEQFQVVIYSSRSKTPEGIAAMKEWLGNQYAKWLEWQISIHQIHDVRSVDMDLLRHLDFAHEKPPAFLTIDDRALTFTGNWDDFAPAKLREFKPWNVKGEAR